MLAPVLARVDEIRGVGRSRAECSGRYFLVELAGAGDGVEERVLEAIGRGARLVPHGEAEVQRKARRRGEPWVTAGEARALSFIEGRILGVRVSDAVSAGGGFGDEERVRLAEAVREEMFSYVEKVHGGQVLPGRFFADWPVIAAAVAERCAEWLSPDRSRELAAALLGLFPSPP